MIKQNDAVNNQRGDRNDRIRVIVIDSNAFTLSCISEALSQYSEEFLVGAYPAINDWQQSGSADVDAVVLLRSRGDGLDQTEFVNSIDCVRAISDSARVIVVCDSASSNEIVAALGRGARGYLSESSSLDVAAAAIRLVRAGGIYIPAGSLLAAPKLEPSTIGHQQRLPFTERQMAVIKRLREGESNKIIAYKLNMGECTVKVHIRNIMQKIKARNRTEIAYLTNEMFRDGGLAAAVEQYA